MSNTVNFNVPEPLKMSEEAHNEFLSFVQKKFTGGNNGKCFFRRVSEVSWLDRPYSITKNIDPSTSIHVDSLTGISKSDQDRYIEIKVPFNAFTLPNAVRDEPKEVNKLKIRLPHTNYSELDLTLNCTFEFSDDKRLCSSTTPLSKDLVFIYMSNQNLKNLNTNKNSPTADKWFIASEQFLRAWTAIMYDWHVTFDEFVSSIIEEDKKEDNLKDKLFGGNRLMTNTWLKYKMAINRPLSSQESREKYWHLRSEIASKKWVDVYTAIVLMARYGELPCYANLPDYKGKESSYGVEIHRSSWYFPLNFVTKLIGCVAPGLITEDNIQNYKEWTQLYECKYFLSDIDKGHRGTIDCIPLLNKIQLFPGCDNTLETSDEYRVFQTIAPRTKKEEFPSLTSSTEQQKPIKNKKEFSSLTSSTEQPLLNSSTITPAMRTFETIESLGDRYYSQFRTNSGKNTERSLDQESWSNMLKTLQVEPETHTNEITLSISPRTKTQNSQITFTSVVDGNQHQEITVSSTESSNNSSHKSPRKITIIQTTTQKKSNYTNPKTKNSNYRSNSNLQYVPKHRQSNSNSNLQYVPKHRHLNPNQEQSIPQQVNLNQEIPQQVNLNQEIPLNKMSPNTRRSSNVNYKILMSISWGEAEEDENY